MHKACAPHLDALLPHRQRFACPGNAVHAIGCLSGRMQYAIATLHCSRSSHKQLKENAAHVVNHGIYMAYIRTVPALAYTPQLHS